MLPEYILFTEPIKKVVWSWRKSVLDDCCNFRKLLTSHDCRSAEYIGKLPLSPVHPGWFNEMWLQTQCSTAGFVSHWFLMLTVLKLFQSSSVPLFMQGWMALGRESHAIGTHYNTPALLSKKLGCKSVLCASYLPSLVRCRRTGHRTKASCLRLFSICHHRKAKYLLPLTKLAKFILRSARSFTFTCARPVPNLPLPNEKPPNIQPTFTGVQLTSPSPASPEMGNIPDVQQCECGWPTLLYSFPDAITAVPAVGSINLSLSLLLTFLLT